jgi:hypothetical protein
MSCNKLEDFRFLWTTGSRSGAPNEKRGAGTNFQRRDAL